MRLAKPRARHSRTTVQSWNPTEGPGAARKSSKRQEAEARMRLNPLHSDTVRRASGICRRDRQGAVRLASWGPGREIATMGEFCIEPQLLSLWKLKKSVAKSLSSHVPVLPRCIGRSIKRSKGPLGHSLSLDQKLAFLSVSAYLLLPSSGTPQLIQAEGTTCSGTRCACRLHGSLLREVVSHTARRRHSRSLSPELPGRIIFFIAAMGRSPPLGSRSCGTGQCKSAIDLADGERQRFVFAAEHAKRVIRLGSDRRSREPGS